MHTPKKIATHEQGPANSPFLPARPAAASGLARASARMGLGACLCAALVCASPALADKMPDQPSADWPLVFDRSGLGDSKLGRYMRKIWDRTPALQQQAIALRVFEGATAASMAQVAAQAGMACNAARTRCDYSGVVRARTLPGYHAKPFFGSSNSLRLTVSATAQADGKVAIQVEKTPIPD